ncbi:hypothetical protein BT67DRAFT_198218 [Trichocladium antarcticum]|uniref:Uncharacterized protein n=1 Tax=Trichocladium antarcticum TaxID=1450529 RepID=A0AAN6UPV7_9PEZI|nr:hypothetical protein BT67DRAFT_198218 [Trichocladium antarcticum]
MTYHIIPTTHPYLGNQPFSSNWPQAFRSTSAMPQLKKAQMQKNTRTQPASKCLNKNHVPFITSTRKLPQVSGVLVSSSRDQLRHTPQAKQTQSSIQTQRPRNAPFPSPTPHPFVSRQRKQYTAVISTHGTCPNSFCDVAEMMLSCATLQHKR